MEALVASGASPYPEGVVPEGFFEVGNAAFVHFAAHHNLFLSHGDILAVRRMEFDFDAVAMPIACRSDDHVQTHIVIDFVSRHTRAIGAICPVDFNRLRSGPDGCGAAGRGGGVDRDGRWG